MINIMAYSLSKTWCAHTQLLFVYVSVTIKKCIHMINIMTYALSNSHGVLTHNCYLFMFQ